MSRAKNKKSYKEMQEFNFLTRWLHSFRYRKINQVFHDLSKKTERPVKVLEIGAAYGKLFNTLDKQFDIEYKGVELYKHLYDEASEAHSDSKNADFILGDATEQTFWDDLDFCPDVIVALETLEHIPEKKVMLLLEQISKASPSLFVFSVPVEKGPSIFFKNAGSAIAGYSRHKEYTWNETWNALLGRYHKLPPHDTGHKGFDWSWLLHSTRLFFRISRVTYFPVNLLPSWFATSVFVEAVPEKSRA